MFDEVTKPEAGKRAARRALWVLGAAAVQVGLVAVLLASSASLGKKTVEGPLVPVRIVRAPAPQAPQPPPPPPAPRRPQVAARPKVEPRPRAPMVPPKEIPAELKPPEPAEAPDEDAGSDDGVEGGVMGGVVGGEVGGVVGAAPGAPVQSGPVKFDASMTPPVLVAGPPLEYTQQALEREVEGTMVVDCIVRVDGAVRACRVVKGLPFMDRAVISNLEQRRYRPATRGGIPLDVEYTFTIRLKLPR